VAARVTTDSVRHGQLKALIPCVLFAEINDSVIIC